MRKYDAPASSIGVSVVADLGSRLDICAAAGIKPEQTLERFPVPGISDCKCGMPLCICEAPAPPKDTVTLQARTLFLFYFPKNASLLNFNI